ncbi:MAG: hypothetical protein ACK5KR_01595, partial [Breznakia sp.]
MKIKEKLTSLTKKQKMYTSLVILTLVGVMVVAFVFVVNRNTSNLKLKQEEVVLEYGEEVSLTASKYVEAKTNILTQTKVTLTNAKYDKVIKDDNEKEILKVGTYQANAKYKDEKLGFTIKV